MKRHLTGLLVALHLGIVILGSFGPSEVSWGPWLSAYHSSRDLRKGYGNALGPKQGWAMFSGVGKRTTRTEIWVNRDGKWRPLWVQGSGAHTWQSGTWDHYRWREMMLMVGGKHRRHHWKRTASWLEDHVLEEVPEADGVRIRRTSARTLTAEQLQAGEQLAFDQVLLVKGRLR